MVRGGARGVVPVVGVMQLADGRLVVVLFAVHVDSLLLEGWNTERRRELDAMRLTTKTLNIIGLFHPGSTLNQDPPKTC